MQGYYEEAADALIEKGIKVVKFRADGDEKDFSKENLSLASFPTILLFPEAGGAAAVACEYHLYCW